MRLIDADAITKETIVNFVGENGGFISHDDMLRLLNEQPTAYDIDEVVKEIANLNLDGIKMIEDGKHELIRKNEVIEIIRKGGVNNG